MGYTYLAIDMLNQHLEEIINVDDTAMESNVFEVDELDHLFIPVSHRALFAEYLTVMTHLYAYKQLIAYVIHPNIDSKSKPILIGLIQEDELLDFKIVFGGFWMYKITLLLEVIALVATSVARELKRKR